MSAGETLRADAYPSALVAAAAGPLAWFVNLEAVYALTPRACATGGRGALHASTLCCFGVVVVGAAIARFNWVRCGKVPPSGDREGWAARVGFLSLFGLASASLFALLILAQWVAVFVLDPCPS